MPSFGRPFDHSSHSTQPPILSLGEMVVKRYLYFLDLDKAVSRVSDGCHSCAAIGSSPTARIDQSTFPPPDAIGRSFATDVIKRSRQLIFLLLETVTSYFSSVSLEDERHQTLCNAIGKLYLELRPMDGPTAVIRTDPPHGFKALIDDPLLKKHRIIIELGQAKNPNKNPVAERAVQELGVGTSPSGAFRRSHFSTHSSRSHFCLELLYPFTWPILARNVDTAGPVFKPAVTPC